MAASLSPRRGAKVTEGPEHRAGTAAVPPRSPSPAQPRLLFSCQNPPHPHHPDSPRNQLLRETAALQRSRSGISGERQKAFGVARLGGMWGASSTVWVMLLQTKPPRSDRKAPCWGCPGCPRHLGSARAASPAPAAFLPGRGGSGRAGAGLPQPPAGTERGGKAGLRPFAGLGKGGKVEEKNP